MDTVSRQFMAPATMGQKACLEPWSGTNGEKLVHGCQGLAARGKTKQLELNDFAPYICSHTTVKWNENHALQLNGPCLKYFPSWDGNKSDLNPTRPQIETSTKHNRAINH